MITLTDSQRKALFFYYNNKHCYFNLGTGIGKTYASLFATQSYFENTIIACENKDIKAQWVRSIETLVKNNNFEDIYTVFTYYELKKMKNRQMYEFDALIFDECQVLCNNNSKRTRKFRGLFRKEWKSVIGLSATPIRHNEADFYSMSKNLGMNIPLTSFTRDQLEDNYFKPGFVYGYDKRTHETHYHMGRVFDPSKIEMFYQLIPLIKIEQDNFVENEKLIKLTKPTMKYYNRLMNDSIVEGHYSTFNKMRKLYGLRMMANSAFKLNTIEWYLYDNDYLLKFQQIDGILKIHKRIIIIYSSEAEKKLLQRYYNTTDKPEVFETTDVPIYIRQIMMSRGKDLKCQCMVFLTLDYSAESFDQMKGRITRESSPYREVWYYYLIFWNTIEKKLWDITQKKLTKNKLIKQLKGE